MPTRKQLYSIWESHNEFFGGSGQPVQTYGVSQDEQGFTTPKHNETLLVSRRRLSKFQGVEIGKISFDPENQDLKITVNP